MQNRILARQLRMATAGRSHKGAMRFTNRFMKVGAYNVRKPVYGGEHAGRSLDELRSVRESVSK